MITRDRQHNDGSFASHWVLGDLAQDPIAPLIASGIPAVANLTRRDLLCDSSTDREYLWELPDVRRILARQQSNGSWRYSGGNPRIGSAANYDQLETYRQLGFLVYKFELDRRHPAVQRAADFLATFQTAAGDYRGIYGNQYTPNYSAAITELLVLTGFESTPQVEKAMQWLLSMLQDDGGWAIPTRTLGMTLEVMTTDEEAYEPDRTRPSSHLITGIVMRAFAVHPRYRHSPVAHRAGELLKSRFFSRDTYPDHVAPWNWLVFSYPFWWTDLLSSLDALTRCGFDTRDPDISRGIAWFFDHQEDNGLWNAGRNRPKGRESDFWVGLAVCRLLKRVSEPPPCRTPVPTHPS
jgi:hypothetical protein